MRRILQKLSLQSLNLPPLVHFLGVHLVLGAAIGVGFVSAMLLLNMAGLKDLMNEADDPVIPLVMLYAFNVITFSGVSMGIAIMTMPAGKK